MPSSSTSDFSSNLPPQVPAGGDWMRPDSTVGPPPLAAGGSAAEFTAVPGYEILGELGRGASGTSCKARHLRSKQLVVLKLLSESRSGGERLERLRALSALRHPNIVSVLSAGEAQGRAYLALEFVDGLTLAQWRARTPPSPHQAAALMEPLARAVQHAHDRGVIHGGLRPGIIRLARLERPTSDLLAVEPKIAGFGLSDTSGTIDGAPESSAAAPHYTSPDSIIGPVGDIWSLGAILYELLAGHPPFEGVTAAETAHLARTLEPIPPSRLRPRLPRDLETICLKCLEKNSGHRYARAGDLADDLARFLADRPIAATPPDRLTRFRRWQRQQRPAAEILLALAALSALGWGLAIHFWMQSR